MTQEADGLYWGPKHLKQTILSYSQFIENGQAKLGQHYYILFLSLHMPQYISWKCSDCHPSQRTFS